MKFDAETKAALQAPLSRACVKERMQAGRKFSYVEGWHAIAEANRIFGFDAWTRETVEVKCVMERERTIGQQAKPGWGVSYIARVRVSVGFSERIVREGIGAGHGIDVDLGQAHESAIKEAETDAMKRALMTFGNPFGLALYDKDQAGVVDEPKPAPASEPTRIATAATPTDRARKWAEMAVVKIPTFKTGKEFDDWHKNNRDLIANVKEYDPSAHAKLIAAINSALGKFNPVGA